MPDLQPDVSIYKQFGQPTGIGAMSLGDLVGMAGRMRELQTQSALSGAAQGATDPQTGITDWSKVPAAAAAHGAYMTPDVMRSMSVAAQAQLETNLAQTKTVSDMVSNYVDNPNLSKNMLWDTVPIMKRAGIPSDMATRFVQNLPDNPAALKNALITFRNWNDNGRIGDISQFPSPTTGLKTPYTGRGSAFVVRGAGEPSMAPPPPASAPTGVPRPLELPPAAESHLERAGKEGDNFLSMGPQLNRNENMLQTLDAFGKEAEAGPATDFMQRMSEYAQEFGLPAPLGPEKLAKTEAYAKTASNLMHQMAVGGLGGISAGHPTDAFLANAHMAIPNTSLSKLGREGITHWLLGTNDAMKLIPQEWAKWLGEPGHAPYSNQFYSWLYNTLPPELGKGFDINNFDPRVFQYARMTPQERKTYTSLMPNAAARAQFHKKLTEYTANGWIGGGGG